MVLSSKRVGSVFYLEVAVSHVCDFALKQAIDVENGSVEQASLPTLRQRSRQSHFHFLNVGMENLVVLTVGVLLCCWKRVFVCLESSTWSHVR